MDWNSFIIGIVTSSKIIVEEVLDRYNSSDHKEHEHDVIVYYSLRPTIHGFLEVKFCPTIDGLLCFLGRKL